MRMNLAQWLGSQLDDGLSQADREPSVLDFVEGVEPNFLVVRSEDWVARAEEPFDRTPPFLNESDPADFVRKAWGWSRSAWTALLAPQLSSIRGRSIRETEPFTFGYLSGISSAIIEFLRVGDRLWLSSSILVGPYADVFGREGLYEAHQLCRAITVAGDSWPSASRLNSFDTGCKAGYIEMIDLLSGDRPAGLLGRFLREGVELLGVGWKSMEANEIVEEMES